METGIHGGLDRRVIDNIRFNARRLARNAPVRGMDGDDYEQDLVLDLLRRSPVFDPTRGSFRTFADRVVQHRATTLAQPTVRSVAERQMVSLDMPVIGDDGDRVRLGDLLVDPSSSIEQQASVRIDVYRFADRLPEPLLDCCALLLADSVVEGVRAAGIHRSTAYDRIASLRKQATADGLAIYVSGHPDSPRSSPVCDDHGERDRPSGADRKPMSMPDRTRPPRIILRVNETELHRWLASAENGAVLEYHRGALAADRLRHATRLGDKDPRELDRVAETVLTLAQSGHGYLLQRRHGMGDYSYLFVARGRHDRTTAALLLMAGGEDGP